MRLEEIQSLCVRVCVNVKTRNKEKKAMSDEDNHAWGEQKERKQVCHQRLWENAARKATTTPQQALR
jgi:hypothetical protein